MATKSTIGKHTAKTVVSASAGAILKHRENQVQKDDDVRDNHSIGQVPAVGPGPRPKKDGLQSSLVRKSPKPHK